MISVIIPVLRPNPVFFDLLDSLARTPEAQTELELLCINNLEKYHSPEIEKKWGASFRSFYVFTTGVANSSAARNLGLRFATGEIIVFLDSDCYINDPQYFSKIKSYHQKWPSMGGIGGPYALPPNSNRYDRAYAQLAEHWLKASIIKEETGETTNLIGGNASYKRRVFEKGLNFDPTIVYGGSELSLNRKIVHFEMGLLFCDDLVVEHRSHLGLGSFLKKAYYQGKGASRQPHAYGSKQPELQHSFLIKLYNLFFHLGYIAGRKKLSMPAKLYQLLEFLQVIRYAVLIKNFFMTIYWKSLPFFGAIKKYTVIFYWLVYPLYAGIKNLFIFTYWTLYPLLSWAKGISLFLLGFLHKLLVDSIGFVAFTLGAMKKYAIASYWWTWPRLKWPFIKLYFMSKYHWETYILGLWKKVFKRAGAKR